MEKFKLKPPLEIIKESGVHCPNCLPGTKLTIVKDSAGTQGLSCLYCNHEQELPPDLVNQSLGAPRLPGF